MVSVKTSRMRVDAMVFNWGTVYKATLGRLCGKTGGRLGEVHSSRYRGRSRNSILVLEVELMLFQGRERSRGVDEVEWLIRVLCGRQTMVSGGKGYPIHSPLVFSFEAIINATSRNLPTPRTKKSIRGLETKL